MTNDRPKGRAIPPPYGASRPPPCATPLSHAVLVLHIFLQSVFPGLLRCLPIDWTVSIFASSIVRHFCFRRSCSFPLETVSSDFWNRPFCFWSLYFLFDVTFIEFLSIILCVMFVFSHCIILIRFPSHFIQIWLAHNWNMIRYAIITLQECYQRMLLI